VNKKQVTKGGWAWLGRMALAVLCVLSAGCWADDATTSATQSKTTGNSIPVAESHPALSDKADSITQSNSADGSSVIASPYEIKLGKNELRFSGKIKDIVYEDCRKDGLCLVIIDDVAVSFSRPQVGYNPDVGSVYWPDKNFYEKIKSYIGRNADVYCRISNNWYMKTKELCTIYGSKNYFIKIH